MSVPHLNSLLCACLWNISNVQGTGKSLARPWKLTSYSDQDLQHYTKTYGVQTPGIYSRCVVSLGRCSLSTSRVGLRTYQRPCICHECDRKWNVSQKHVVEKSVIHPNHPYLYQTRCHTPEQSSYWCAVRVSMVTSAQIYGVTPCSFGDGYQCFEEKDCLYLQGGKDGTTIQLRDPTMEPKSRVTASS